VSGWIVVGRRGLDIDIDVDAEGFEVKDWLGM
jgi:hypothetical protein